MTLINHINADSFVVDEQKILAILPKDKIQDYFDEGEYLLSDIEFDFDTCDFFNDATLLSITDDKNKEIFSLSNQQLVSVFGISWIEEEESLYASYQDNWLFVMVSWASGQAGSWALFDIGCNQLILKGEEETSIQNLIWTKDDAKLILIRDLSTYRSFCLSCITVTKQINTKETCLISNNNLDDKPIYKNAALTVLQNHDNNVETFALSNCGNQMVFPYRGVAYTVALADLI